MSHWGALSKILLHTLHFVKEFILIQIAEDDPYNLIVAGEISAIEAVNHPQGSYGLDSRPKVFDKKSNSWILLDSGSCLSCVPKEPGDVVDSKLKLRSVNGGIIQTYGTKEIFYFQCNFAVFHMKSKIHNVIIFSTRVQNGHSITLISCDLLTQNTSLKLQWMKVSNSLIECFKLDIRRMKIYFNSSKYYCTIWNF